MVFSKGLIITVAPTGNVVSRAANPHLPVTPEEIATDVYRCYLAGASVAHLHARDAGGRPTGDPALFKEIVCRIREKCDIVIQLSTGPRGGKSAAERAACLALEPEMASLATGSSNFSTTVNYNPPDLIKKLAREMKARGIKPEIEVFDLSALEQAIYLAGKGLLMEPLHVNLVLHVPGSLRGTPRNLFYLVESIPPGWTWTVSGIGSSHRRLSALGLALGGHVRTGIEDVPTLGQDRPASNLELVEWVAGLANAYGRVPATPAEARAILSLPGLIDEGSGWDS